MTKLKYLKNQRKNCSRLASEVVVKAVRREYVVPIRTITRRSDVGEEDRKGEEGRRKGERREVIPSRQVLYLSRLAH